MTIATTRTLALAFIIFASVGISVASAQTVVRSSDAVSVAEDEAVEGDFYSAGNIVNVSGEIAEDALIAGGQVNINGTIGADALLVGGQVDIHGGIADDARVLAGEVIVAEPIEGDLVIVGGTARILSTASVGGDVFLIAGDVTIEGSVGGDVFGRIERLRIDGPVAGDVDVTVGEITLGDRSDIQGSVRYVSSNVAIQAQNANVVGELVRNDPVLPDQVASWRSVLIPLLILLFSALVWYLISRRTLSRVVERSLSPSVRPVLFGVALFLFAPVAIAVTMASMIGFLIGLAALFGFGLLLTLSFIALPAVIGQLMTRLFSQPSNQISIFTIAVGVIGVALLMFVPFIGPVVTLGFTIVTFGAGFDLLLRPKRRS